MYIFFLHYVVNVFSNHYDIYIVFINQQYRSSNTRRYEAREQSLKDRSDNGVATIKNYVLNINVDKNFLILKLKDCVLNYFQYFLLSLNFSFLYLSPLFLFLLVLIIFHWFRFEVFVVCVSLFFS